jgi:biotin carboxyl carrier protein
MARVGGNPAGGTPRGNSPGTPRAGPAGVAPDGASNRGRAQRVTFPGLTEEPGSSLVVEIAADGSVRVDETPTDVSHEPLGQDRVRLSTPDGTHTAVIVPLPDASRAAAGVGRVEVVVDGWRFEVDVEPEARARLRERATSADGATKGAGPLELRAIIPGRVVSVDVALGDAVEPGGRLLVIEAMKMQNELRSPRTGTVARLAVGAGQTVERGDLLLVLE